MHLVIFTHPSFLGSQSMPRYAKMLADGLRAQKHTVEIWTAKEFFYRMPLPIKKWLGYVDQFVVFPLQVKRRLKRLPKDTLFVFSDHGLGPWVFMVSNRPHVIHCHDFLAQRSERRELSENKLGLSGKIYQRWIRKGYKKGKNFISISYNTRKDLHWFLSFSPKISEVVYNGLNQNFKPGNQMISREELKREWKIELENGFILHVGGNQFYKNRKGVIKIYDAWRKNTNVNLPLLMIGPEPNKELKATRKAAKYLNDIYFLSNIPDELLQNTYRAATVLLFPSLEEGFGWPIAEAMASGCPVITTGRAPMTEVGDDSCFYIHRMPAEAQLQEKWIKDCADDLEKVINLSKLERNKIIDAGIENAKRFNTQKSIENIEAVYKKILKNSTNENITGYSLDGPY